MTKNPNEGLDHSWSSPISGFSFGERWSGLDIQTTADYIARYSRESPKMSLNSVGWSLPYMYIYIYKFNDIWICIYIVYSESRVQLDMFLGIFWLENDQSFSRKPGDQDAGASGPLPITHLKGGLVGSGGNSWNGWAGQTQKDFIVKVWVPFWVDGRIWHDFTM